MLVLLARWAKVFAVAGADLQSVPFEQSKKTFLSYFTTNTSLYWLEASAAGTGTKSQKWSFCPQTEGWKTEKSAYCKWQKHKLRISRAIVCGTGFGKQIIKALSAAQLQKNLC